LYYAIRGEREKALAHPIRSALIYAELGMADEAIAALREVIAHPESVPIGSYSYQYLLYNPFLRKLSGDPRFERILARQRAVFEENRRKYR
jgi:hypothetical protein